MLLLKTFIRTVLPLNSDASINERHSGCLAGAVVKQEGRFLPCIGTNLLCFYSVLTVSHCFNCLSDLILEQKRFRHCHSHKSLTLEITDVRRFCSAVRLRHPEGARPRQSKSEACCMRSRHSDSHSDPPLPFFFARSPGESAFPSCPPS